MSTSDETMKEKLKALDESIESSKESYPCDAAFSTLQRVFMKGWLPSQGGKNCAELNQDFGKKILTKPSEACAELEKNFSALSRCVNYLDTTQALNTFGNKEAEDITEKGVDLLTKLRDAMGSCKKFSNIETNEVNDMAVNLNQFRDFHLRCRLPGKNSRETAFSRNTIKELAKGMLKPKQ